MRAQQMVEHVPRRLEITLIHQASGASPEQLRVGGKPAESVGEQPVGRPAMQRTPANGIGVGDVVAVVGNGARPRGQDGPPERARGIRLPIDRVVRLPLLAFEFYRQFKGIYGQIEDSWVLEDNDNINGPASALATLSKTYRLFEKAL